MTKSFADNINTMGNDTENNKYATAENTPVIPSGRRDIKDAEKDHHWIMAILILVLGILYNMILPSFVSDMKTLQITIGIGILSFLVIWALSTVGCITDLIHKRFSFFNKLGMFISLLSPIVFLMFTALTFFTTGTELAVEGLQSKMSEMQSGMQDSQAEIDAAQAELEAEMDSELAKLQEALSNLGSN